MLCGDTNKIMRKNSEICLEPHTDKQVTDVYTMYSPDVTAAEIREIYGDFLPEF